ncbi:hypothetical protein A2U01_0119256, partial [Trifolium medium]|nr:hypothetical protein [Trifolium medium]
GSAAVAFCKAPARIRPEAVAGSTRIRPEAVADSACNRPVIERTLWAKF